MKKLLALVLFLSLTLTACGGAANTKNDSKTNESNKSSKVSEKVDESTKQDNKEESETTVDKEETINADNYCIIAKIEPDISDGYNYYWIYSHVGAVVDGEFLSAYLTTRQFTINGGDTPNYSWEFLVLNTPSKDYDLRLLRIREDVELTSVDIDWEPDGYDPVNLHDISFNSSLDEIPEIDDVFKGNSAFIIPVDGMPFNVKDRFVYSSDDSYYTSLKAGGDLTVAPFYTFNGYSLEELRDYITDNFIVGVMTDFSQSRTGEYVKIDLEKFPHDIYLYREESAPFDWDTLDTTAERWNFDAPNSLYVVYEDGEYDNSTVYWGYTTPDGVDVWIGLLK